MSKFEIQPDKKPAFIAYQVSNSREQSHWNRIGAAWAHSDGKGFTLSLDSYPRDGFVSLRTPLTKQE